MLWVQANHNIYGYDITQHLFTCMMINSKNNTGRKLIAIC